MRRFLFLLVSFALLVLMWWGVTAWANIPRFLLPGPGDVAARFWTSFRDGSLARHTLTTLLEVLVGLAIGVSTATLLGYLLVKSSALERVLTPYVIASQAIPIVAIAPLLIIWFGPGLFSKILICALIVFFPVLINTMIGMRSVSFQLRELMRSLRATSFQIFWLLEVPAAMPVFLGGLRIGATLSVIGAVVGEFVGADRGLGYLVNAGRGVYDTALVFVAVFGLISMALLLYGCVRLLEAWLLRWVER